jgi:protein phosphatase
VRAHNEDAVLLRLPVLAIADGVGGARRGEVASGTALERIEQWAAQLGAVPSDDELRAAVSDANSAVYGAQTKNPDVAGMATTLTVAVVGDDGAVHLGHVGDSRAYRIGEGSIAQLTEDHSIVGELVRSGRLDSDDAESHPQRNVITRAIGTDEHVAVDTVNAELRVGEWLLICSDGLTAHVDDATIAEIVTTSSGIDSAVDRLIDAANAGGGTDNISIALARHVDPTAPPARELTGEIDIAPIDRVDDTGSMPIVDPGLSRPIDQVPTQPTESPPRKRASRSYVPVFVALAAVAAFAVGVFAWSQSYYLVEREDGLVGADQGFPVPGMHREWRTSDVNVEDLEADDQAELLNRPTLRSEEDVEKLLDSLPERAGRCDTATGAIRDPACPEEPAE